VPRVSRFEGPALVASGSEPTRAVAPYLVTVEGGRLTLAVARRGGTVLDVPLTSVGLRPLGRAGAVVVDVDQTPVLVDFTVRAGETGYSAGALPRRVLRGLRGRAARRRFVAAAGAGR
jgi:hypothetical protein